MDPFNNESYLRLPLFENHEHFQQARIRVDSDCRPYDAQVPKPLLSSFPIKQGFCFYCSDNFIPSLAIQHDVRVARLDDASDQVFGYCVVLIKRKHLVDWDHHGNHRDFSQVNGRRNHVNFCFSESMLNRLLHSVLLPFDTVKFDEPFQLMLLVSHRIMLTEVSIERP